MVYFDYMSMQFILIYSNEGSTCICSCELFRCPIGNVVGMNIPNVSNHPLVGFQPKTIGNWCSSLWSSPVLAMLGFVPIQNCRKLVRSPALTAFFSVTITEFLSKI